MCGMCVCGFVCSYIAVSLIQLATASVIVHGYPCQAHLATLANELMSRLESVQQIDDIVQMCDVVLERKCNFWKW